jgi:ABC-type cobalamin transport system permease subunit
MHLLAEHSEHSVLGVLEPTPYSALSLSLCAGACYLRRVPMWSMDDGRWCWQIDAPYA